MDKRIRIEGSQFAGHTTKGQIVYNDWGVQFTGKLSYNEGLMQDTVVEGVYRIPWNSILYIREYHSE